MNALLANTTTSSLSQEEVSTLLMPFCAGVDDNREHLRTMFSHNGLTWATAGYVAVCVIGEYAPPLSGATDDAYASVTKALTSLLDASSPAHFAAPPEIHFKGDGWFTCKECNGKRVITHDSDYNSYEWPCESCEGDGGFVIKEQVIIPGMRHYYDANATKKVLALPSVELSRMNDIVCFRFEHGFGFLSGGTKTNKERCLEKF